MPASFKRIACSREMSPKEQHTSIPTSLRIRLTIEIISSNSLGLSWLRPLVTSEKRTAPAAFAFFAASTT